MRGPTYRTMFALCYGLGLRAGEACGLVGVVPSYKFEGARRVAVRDLEAYEAARREERAA